MKISTGYSRVQIALHWLVALAVGYNFLFSEGMGRALRQKSEGAEFDAGLAAPHVWIGVAVLLLVVLRLVVLLRNGAPQAGAVTRAWHGMLYLLALLVPVSGGLAWFAGVEAVADPHGAMATLLVILAGLHAVMALVHHFLLKDDTLRRMLRPVAR